MKMTTAKTVGSLAIGAALLFPSLTFAADATTSGSVHINQDGIVRVVDAQVTSISGNIINAVTNLKNTVLNWAVTTNASTTVRAGATTTLAGIHVGDKINIEGALATLGSTIGLTATTIHDRTAAGSSTSTSSAKVRTGVVQSVNTANGTFVLKSDDKTFTVQTNASTSWMLNGTSTNALSSLVLNSRVVVLGTMSTDHSVMTASRIMQFVPKADDNDDKDGKENKGKAHKINNGFFHGLKLGLRAHLGL